MGGFQHRRSRRTRELAVWVDSNIDGAGEQESLLYGWIPTLVEQENKRACCIGGFQHWRSRRAREPACITAAAGALVFEQTFNNLLLIQISPRCGSSMTQCSPHFATHSPRKRVCICTTAKWVVCCQECR